jgi:MFS family permease
MHLKSKGIDPRSTGWIFSSLALSTIFAPLVHGRLADRKIAAEKILAFSYTIGAFLLIGITQYQGNSTIFLFLFFMVYWLLVAPGFSLSNTISLRHLAQPREEFGGVRLWGTVGWMAGSYAVATLLIFNGSKPTGTGIPLIFYVGGFLSLLTAFQALRLTPSPPMESAGTGFIHALRSDLLHQKDFVIYLCLGFGVCLTTPFVFQLIPSLLEREGLSRPQVMTAMTLGQVPEIFALWTLPWIVRRIGFRGALFLGILSWVIRYGVIAAGAPLIWIILSMPMQGLAIGFFMVGGQVFVDEKSPRESRASIQALQVMITSGLGSFLGSLLAGECQMLWPNQPEFVFLVPCIIDLVLCFVLLIWFQPSTVLDKIGSKSLPKL